MLIKLIESKRNKMSNLKIKSKLLVMFFSVTVPSILIIGTLGYITGKSSLSLTIFNQLTSIRSTKAYQIKTYFHNMRAQVDTLSESKMLISATKDFNLAFSNLKNNSIGNEVILKNENFYKNIIKPEYDKKNSDDFNVDQIIPKSKETNLLQYEYISNNPFPIGEKEKLTTATTLSQYNKVHSEYHGIFKSYIENFGFYDMFIINKEGDIIYTVYKEIDYGTNLFTGPYKNTHFSELVKSILNSKKVKHSKISDFESYTPSMQAPSAFIADIIEENGQPIGVLGFQLPVNEINKVMTGGGNWKDDGLGSSGETYLVGQDFKMRSNSRFLIESPGEYFKMLDQIGIDSKEINKIRNYNTSILEQTVKTLASIDAMNGSTNTQIVLDYRGVPVLSSYSKLDIEDLDWSILSEIDLDEAYEPIYRFTKLLILFTIILSIIITFIVFKFTKLFIDPIEILMKGTHELAVGNYDKRVSISSKDEFGELADTFNKMASSIEEKNAEIHQKNIENEKLLLNILPPQIATRLRSGEQTIADSFPNVAVLFADLVGFTRLSQENGAEKIVELLNQLFSNFDVLAHKHGVEKIKTIGDCYMAVSGLPIPREDFAEAMVDLAIEMIECIKELNKESSTVMELRIGINSGPVVAGVIGTSKFIYDLWGDTVNLASRMESHGLPNEIHTTEDLFLLLSDKYDFESRGSIDVKGKGPTKTYFLRGKKLQGVLN